MRFFFFFSSRRRHTRCSRDWSSDVCSSDLGSDLDGLAHLPHEAVLVIGDAALLLAARRSYPHRIDLGEEWKRWTGLPFEEIGRKIDELKALGGRSEEHTSELQSRLHLVCRLLL